MARVGGDEFVVLLDHYRGHRAPNAVAEIVTTSVRRTVGAGEHALRVTASVGVATIDLAVEPDARPDQLLSRADAAMYLAKEEGRNRHAMFRVPGPAALPAPREESVLY